MKNYFCHFGGNAPESKKLHRAEFLVDFDIFFVFRKVYLCALWENYKRLIPGSLNGPNRPGAKNVTRFTEDAVCTYLQLEIC